jgi:hypothetical protein
MNIQYFFVYLPGHGWSIGTSPNMLVNCYANKVTFPIGLNISKAIKIGPPPVELAIQGPGMPVILMSSARSGICIRNHAGHPETHQRESFQ